MAIRTGIQWCDCTWNPWMGCKKISPGCKNCYMFRDMTRYGRDPNKVMRAAPATFNAPIKWAQNRKLHEGARIFTCSWSDWFIEEADAWRDEAWEIIRATLQFNYLILTKRPERIFSHLPSDWSGGYTNVWLGVSIESQSQANERVPILMNTPAKIRFISAEPLLAPIDLDHINFGLRYVIPSIPEPWSYDAFTDRLVFGNEGDYELGRVHWVITGGESDLKNPRRTDPDWIRSIRDQCLEAGVPYFHKQNGGTRKINGAWGGREIDGVEWNEFPNP
jgi:protein gp37